MTLRAPTTEELFQRALTSVRSAPIEADCGPVQTRPSTPTRSPKTAPGPVTGPASDIWATMEALRAGEITVGAVVAAAAERMHAHGSRLHVFEYEADVRDLASTLHGEALSDAWRGPLHGIPLSVKDIIDVEGMPTSGSSRATTADVARRDATAVRRLRDAGAVLVGKAVTHEFALGVTTPQSRNPWDETRVPGGSSGGSAISIVTGMAHGSLGSDTRASIRVPAALCGLVGFRPTTGIVPLDHWLTLSWTLDILAPMARSVRDVALLTDVLTAGEHDLRRALPGSLEGTTIGWSELFLERAEPGVRHCFGEAIDAAARAGASIVRCDDLDAEDIALSNDAGVVLSRVEAAHFHAERQTRLDLCTPEIRGQLLPAGAVDAVDYVRCLRIREQLRRRFLSVFAGIDVMMMPTAKVVAPRIEEADDYLLVLSENCIPWSLVSFPAINLFSGVSDGLPVGVQLVAPPGDDAFLLSAAHALEQRLPPIPQWRP